MIYNAITIATRGILSDAIQVFSKGRILPIHELYKHIRFTSSVRKIIELTSFYESKIELTSSIIKKITLESSINKDITIVSYISNT